MLSQSRNMKEMREKNRIEQRHRKQMLREFPGGPVVRTSHSHCQWPRFHPSGQGTKILQSEQHGQKNKANA